MVVADRQAAVVDADVFHHLFCPATIHTEFCGTKPGDKLIF